VNRQFVGLWVGPRFFGGAALTVLVALNFMARLVDYTLALALFAFGYEKQSAIRFLLDGLASVSVALLLVGPFGLPGIVGGLLFGATCVALPMDIYFLSRELRIPILQVLRPYAPYAWRCGVIGVAAYAVLQKIEISNLFTLAIAAIVIGFAYLLLVVPYAWRSALGDYLRPLLAGLQSALRDRGLGWSNNT
jgi:hypothetical protein